MEARINKELALMMRDPTPGITVEMQGNDKTKLIGTLDGPKGTPYEGGSFIVDIEIPRDYPILPPKVKFRTRVFHPNVSSQTGAICLDILKNEWSPALSIKTTLLSLQALLSTPEPKDPQDAQVADLYVRDYAEFVRTASNWTATYAKSDDPKVKALVEMGFATDKVKAALEAAGGDQDAALEKLLASA